MRHTLLALACLAMPAAIAAAQDPAPALRVEIDDANGATRLIRGTDTVRADANGILRVPAGVPVTVRVVNTNTALYHFTQQSAAAALPELEPVRSFLAKAAPYIPQLHAVSGGSGASSGGGGKKKGFSDGAGANSEAAARAAADAIAAALIDVQESLSAMDDAMFGANGLRAVSTASLAALEHMRRGTAPEAAAAELRRLTNAPAPCTARTAPLHLAATASLLDGASSLMNANAELDDALAMGSFASSERWRALHDTAAVMAERSRAAVADLESLTSAAYATERLAGVVASACSHWDARSAKVTLTGGREITIRAEPRDEPEIARVAERQAREYQVVLQPRVIVRPLVAVAATFAPGAQFAQFGTRPSGSGAEVYEKGTTDSRLGVGATLGFTWPGLDGRTGSGVAMWLPEFTVVKSGATHALGVGPAISWGIIKLGAGAMWVHHTELKGATVGSVLPTGTEAPVQQVYGKPRFYLSVSATELPGIGRR